ncbi:MAG: BglII/BstYI family type II restriction endonuclease [Flavobacteriales bacterium]
MSKTFIVDHTNFTNSNHTKNISSLRNLCFGELHYHEGEKRWNEFLNKNEDLSLIAKELEQKEKIGIDLEYSESDTDTPLVVGEIQFGNWALAYRDFFKVLKANVQNSIDCLVYVVPTGELELMLSDGIVTYDKSVKILNDFAKVISVPVWVIGIDIK